MYERNIKPKCVSKQNDKKINKYILKNLRFCEKNLKHTIRKIYELAK